MKKINKKIQKIKSNPKSRFSLIYFFLFPLKSFLRPPFSLSQWLKEHGIGKSEGHTVVCACANYLHEKQLFTYEMD